MAIRSSRTRSPNSSENWLGRLLKRKWLLANLCVAAVVVSIAAGVYFLRDDGKSSEVAKTGKRTTKAKETPPVRGAINDAPKSAELVLCRIYTPEPGFFVFIDGNPVRQQDGEKRMTTPCEVAVPRGPHQFSIAKGGFRDAHENVNVKQNLQEINFPKSAKAADGGSELLNAAHLNAAPREPIPLFSNGNAGEMFDPYVTPDGTLLYFVGNRSGYRGIYFASRSSAYAGFDGQPKLIESTRGYDVPASPSLSPDNLSIVYTLPKQGAVYAVSRETPVGDFTKKKVILPRKQDSRRICLSVQAVADRQRAWWLYWLQRAGGKTRSYAATSKQKRTSDTLENSNETSARGTQSLAALPFQDFSVRKSNGSLRGGHPCLSQDGLRQYTFDGKFLKRARRRSFAEPFSEFELVTSIDIADYSPAADRRAFSISNDEQWLFYESKGKLYMLRVFDGPGRGFVARGKTISQRVPKVAKLPVRKKMPDPKVAKKDPPEKKVDPRTLPLPYPRFRAELAELVKARKYAEAKKKISAGLADARLAKDKDLIVWDREELDLIEAFWRDVETAVKSMKPGDPFSIGNARVKFAGFAAGVLTAKSQTKTVTKPIRKMRPSDLIAFIEKKFGRKETIRQLRIAAFLHHDAQGSPSVAVSRFKRGGDDGKQFLERQAARVLQQARHEFDRDNIARGLILSKRVLTEFPKSKATAGARELEERAYTQTKWVKQGRRTWRESNGAYSASKTNSPGSILRSPRQYANFELRLEWKSDVATGQGGVFFRYPGRGNPTDTSFKIQFSDDFGIPADNFCTGALFKVEPPRSNAVRKRGEWNTLNLQVRGDSVTAIINGSKVLDTKATSETIPKKGYVALDGVLGGITYRRVLLVELPD